jgi:hypothetical protein
MIIMLPEGFDPPRSHEFSLYKLTVLGPTFADLDFHAVKASAENIRHVFGPSNDWPNANITHLENYADLVRHEREFNERVAFAYSLLDRKGELYLGCLYVKPIKSKREVDRRKHLFQAQAFLWFSSAQRVIDQTEALVEIQEWLSNYWPLNSIAWPGRVQGWAEWDDGMSHVR